MFRAYSGHIKGNGGWNVTSPDERGDTDDQPPGIRSAELTRQEKVVLLRLETGASNPDIARGMMVSRNTVKKHLGNAYRKLDVHSRVAAALCVRALRESGKIHPPG